MCMVSMVYDDYRHRFPVNPNPPSPWQDQMPLTIDISAVERAKLQAEINRWKTLYENLKRDVEKARQEDRRTGAKDCEDPKKAKYEQDVMARIRQLEDAVEKIVSRP